VAWLLRWVSRVQLSVLSLSILYKKNIHGLTASKTDPIFALSFVRTVFIAGQAFKAFIVFEKFHFYKL
jgi:hypothetical protein